MLMGSSWNAAQAYRLVRTNQEHELTERSYGCALAFAHERQFRRIQMETRAHFGDQTTDVVTHERTYHAFSILTRWAMLVIGDLLLWFTLWFATPAGFLGGTFVALVVFVIGY